MEEASLQLGSNLSDLEVRILDFERQWWKYAGAKDAAIKELFDLSTRSYYELLNNLIDREDALHRLTSSSKALKAPSPGSNFSQNPLRPCGAGALEKPDLRTGIEPSRLGVSTRQVRVISHLKLEITG